MFGRKKKQDPPTDTGGYAQEVHVPDDLAYLRANLHRYIDGMDEYTLRTTWSFVIMFYPQDIPRPSSPSGPSGPPGPPAWW